MSRLIRDRNGFGTFEVLAVVLTVLILVSIGYFFVFNSTHAKPTPRKASSTQSAPSASSSTGLELTDSNTERKNDAATIAAGIDDYESNNAGQLPQYIGVGKNAFQLLFCSSACSASTEGSYVNLGFYHASDVKIEKYSSTLKAPNSTTVYIVLNSLCHANTSGSGTIGSATTSLQVAVLFALQNGQSLEQQCIAA